MKEKKIMLPTIAEAKRFVEEATKCDFDIDVFYNRIIIDAKSILGVLSLDLTRILTVQFNGDDERNLRPTLRRFYPRSGCTCYLIEDQRLNEQGRVDCERVFAIRPVLYYNKGTYVLSSTCG